MKRSGICGLPQSSCGEHILWGTLPLFMLILDDLREDLQMEDSTKSTGGMFKLVVTSTDRHAFLPESAMYILEKHSKFIQS